jgi:hypothetical protein
MMRSLKSTMPLHHHTYRHMHQHTCRHMHQHTCRHMHQTANASTTCRLLEPATRCHPRSLNHIPYQQLLPIDSLAVHFVDDGRCIVLPLPEGVPSMEPVERRRVVSRKTSGRSNLQPNMDVMIQSVAHNPHSSVRLSLNGKHSEASNEISLSATESVSQQRNQ